MPERKRYRQVCLRLTDDEYALIEKKCSDSGLSKTDFFVSVLKNSTVKVYRIEETLRPLISQLRHIGANINQLAYFSNIGQEKAVRDNIESIRMSHNRLMNEISEFLKTPRCTADVR